MALEGPDFSIIVNEVPTCKVVGIEQKITRDFWVRRGERNYPERFQQPLPIHSGDVLEGLGTVISSSGGAD